MESSQALHLATLLFFSFGVNVPLGYVRMAQRKFSLLWFIYIHVSIPFIIAARLAYGFGWSVVPLTLACAVTGQLIGGRLNRRAKP